MFGFNFVIEDLIYIATGDYAPMYSRPYMLNVLGNSIDVIRNKLDENRTNKITPGIISGYSNTLIQPAAVANPTAIDNNWVSTRKFIFLMKVSYMSNVGVLNRIYIQGYTDHDGITNNGTIDFNMRHHINSVIETSVISYNTPMGVITEEKLTKIYNVINNRTIYSDYMYLQRPTDIVSNINNLSLMSMMERADSINLEDKSFTISSLDNRSMSSKIDNNIPTRYLADVFSATLTSSLTDDSDFMSDFTFTDGNMRAKDMLKEPSIQDNPFLYHISALAGYKTAVNEFTFNSLAAVDNTITNRFKVLNITKQYVDPTMAQTPTVGEYWHGQDMLTVKAYSLIEACVSMATRYGFSKLNFVCSNMMDVTGQPTMTIMYFNSFLQLRDEDFSKLMAIFENTFLSEVFNDETNFNTMPLHIEMYVDVLGTSKINLAYGGSPLTWYTIPTFANSLYTPVVTVNKEAFDNMSELIANATEVLHNGSSQQQSYY